MLEGMGKHGGGGKHGGYNKHGGYGKHGYKKKHHWWDWGEMYYEGIFKLVFVVYNTFKL